MDEPTTTEKKPRYKAKIKSVAQRKAIANLKRQKAEERGLARLLKAQAQVELASRTLEKLGVEVGTHYFTEKMMDTRISEKMKLVLHDAVAATIRKEVTLLRRVISRLPDDNDPRFFTLVGQRATAISHQIYSIQARLKAMSGDIQPPLHSTKQEAAQSVDLLGAAQDMIQEILGDAGDVKFGRHTTDVRLKKQA